MSRSLSAEMTADADIRVLHVDDEPTLAEMAAQFLKREDDRMTVQTATDASEALTYLADNDVDCIVSDYDMPGQNGIELLGSVREEYPDLPYILYTGKGSEEIASDAISAGVTDYLQKEPGTDHYTILANRIINAVEHYHASREIDRQRDLFTKAQEIATVGAWEYNLESGPSYATDEVSRIHGLPPGESVSPEGSIEYYHPEDRDQIRDAFQRAIEEGVSYDLELRLIDNDGNRRWVQTRGEPQVEGGEIVRVRGTIQDITDRKQREQELETVFQRMDDAVFVHDEDGAFMFVNQTAVERYGYEESEFYDMSPPDIDVANETQGVSDIIERVREEGQLTFETEHQLASGETSPVEINATATSFRGKPAILSIARNITERKERERELEESRERYRSLFESNPLVIWEQDFSAGKRYLDDLSERVDDLEAYLLANPEEAYQLLDRLEILDINENALEYYGAPSKAVLLENFEQVFTEDALESFISACVALAQGQRQYRMEAVARTLHGEEKHELLELYVPDAYADDLSRIYTTGMDITEHKEQAQELKRQNERLAEFATIVSHDLRNPLNLASGRLELAQTACNSDYLDDVQRAHDRMEELIDDLLTLAREGKRVRETEPIELADTIDRCWATTETENGTLVTETEQTIQADPSRLQELLENLLRNAIEHAGDNVTVTVGDLDDRAGFYVADDGVGISDDEREQVFDTGYATTEGGTGFGLNIAQEIAEAHGWTIIVTDSDDGGVRFEISDVDATDR